MNIAVVVEVVHCIVAAAAVVVEAPNIPYC